MAETRDTFSFLDEGAEAATTGFDFLDEENQETTEGFAFLDEDATEIPEIQATTQDVEPDDGIISGMAKGIVNAIPEAIDNTAAVIYDVMPQPVVDFFDGVEQQMIKAYDLDPDVASPTYLTDNMLKLTGDLNTAGQVSKDISKVLLTFALTKRFAPQDLSLPKTIGVNVLRMVPGDLLFWSKEDAHLADIAADAGIQNAVVDFLKSDPNDPTWYHNLKGAIESGFVGTGMEAFGHGLLLGYRSLKSYLHSNASSVQVVEDLVDEVAKQPIVPAKMTDDMKVDDVKPPHTQINYTKTPVDKEYTEMLLNSKTVRDAYNLDKKPQDLTEIEAKELQKALGTDGLIELSEGVLKNVQDLDVVTVALRRELFELDQALKVTQDIAINATGIEQQKAIVKYMLDLETFNRLAINVKGIQTPMARGLAAQNIFAFDDSKLRAVMDYMTDHPGQFDEIMGELLSNKGMSQKELAKALDVIQSLEAGAKNRSAAKEALKADSKIVKTMRVLLENMYNGILSNPITHKINMIGNTSSSLARLTEHYIATGIGYTRQGINKITGKSANGANDYIRLNELAALHKGHISGAYDTLQVIKNALARLPEGTASVEDALQKGFLTNVGKLDEDAMNRYLSAQYLNLEGTAGQAVDVAGFVNRTALNMLGIEDDFFKRMAFNSHAHYMAVREMNKKGFKTTAEKDQFIQDFLKVMDLQQTLKRGGTVTKESYDLIAKIDGSNRFYDEGILQAKEITFQEDLGKAGQDFVKWKKDALGGAGNVIMPFVKTPTNLIKWLVRRTPGLNAISSKSRRMWAAGGRERDIVMAQLTLGTSLYALAYSMYQDNKITGIAPQGHRAAWESAGILESAFVTEEGETIQYNRADPIASFFNIVASMGQFYDEMARKGVTEDEQFIEDWDKVTFAVISSFSENTLNKTYTTGITEFLRAMDDPSPEKWEKYAHQKGLMFAPFSGMSRYLSEDNENNRKLALDFFDKVKDLYGNREDLPDRPDVYGKVAPTPEKFHGVQKRKISKSPIRQEMARLGIMLPRMKNEITYKGIPIELNAKEYSDMLRILDTHLQAEEILSEYVKSPAYKNLAYDGIDWSKENTKRGELQGQLNKLHKKAQEIYINTNAEVLNRYITEYQARLESVRANRPMAIDRWLPKPSNKVQQDAFDFLNGE